MELFIPSVLVLLLAAAVVFFVLPRFGASVLALISVVLLVFGIHQHMNAFGTEYKLSTWHLGLVSYAPYVMIGGLLLVIGFYLLSISPLGKANAGTTAPSMPEIPTIAEMPPANTATNVMTSGVNNALKAAGNVAGVAAIKNAGNVANDAVSAMNQVTNTITNVFNKAKNAVVGNINANMKNKPANVKMNNNAKPVNNKVPGLGFPLSQV
jgi:hypothetical protein